MSSRDPVPPPLPRPAPPPPPVATFQPIPGRSQPLPPRKFSPAAIIVSVVVLLVVGLAVATLAVSTFTGKQIVIQPARIIGTPEQLAVRAWLKENSDSGEWEEVKWLSVGKEEIQWFPEEYRLPNTTVTRLKYRTQGLGGKILMDEYFVVSDGKAVESGRKSILDVIAANTEKLAELEAAMVRDQAATVKFIEDIDNRRVIPQGSQGTMPGRSNEKTDLRTPKQPND